MDEQQKLKYTENTFPIPGRTEFEGIRFYIDTKLQIGSYTFTGK
jgi:hypothetical protein